VGDSRHNGGIPALICGTLWGGDHLAGRGMRALFWAALLVAGPATTAGAQLAVGPIAITNTVNGIPITVSASSTVTVSAIENERTVDARIFVDLIDLQRKFPNLMDTFRPPADNCANRGADRQSPVVSLKSTALWPVDDQLMMSINGRVDVWSCIAKSPKSEIEWKKKKIGFLKINVPVMRTVRAVTKKMEGSQSFRGNLPVQLVKKDGENVTFKLAEPEIKMEGQNALLTNANLNVAKMDINKKAFNALQSAISPAKLKSALPKEFQNLNMKVVSTRFRSYGGHAIAEINLAATSTPNTQ